MERKSIGTLIAALRRANGMTQKELAERLNVSDKAVSRWERDESLPDLTLLPLIADIFHITVDELLRGERKNAPEGNPLDTQAEQARLRKQMKRVTDAAMARLRGRMLAVVGVGLLALLGAIICNFGFQRVDMAALVGLVIWAGAAAMLAVFAASALRGMDDEDYDAQQAVLYRRQVIAWCKWIGFALLAILAMILPFLIGMVDASREDFAFINVFIRADRWFSWSLLCGACLSVCAACALYLINKRLVEKGLYASRRRVRLLGIVAGALAVVMIGTAFAAFVIKTNGSNVYRQGTTFDRFEDFKEYCDELAHEQSDSYEVALPAEGMETTVLIDGREMTEQEWWNEYVLDSVYDEEGNLIGRFDPTGIASWSCALDGDHWQFTAYTYENQAAAKERYNAVQSSIAILFTVEPVIALIAWLMLKDTEKKSKLHQ